MMRRLLSLMLVLAPGCSATWGRRAVLAGSNAVVLCDLSQTLWMSDHGRWDRHIVEGNPMLGEHPTPGMIVFASLASVAMNTAAYLLLSHRWGTAVNAGVLVVEGANVSTQDQGAPIAASHGIVHHGCDVQRQL